MNADYEREFDPALRVVTTRVHLHQHKAPRDVSKCGGGFAEVWELQCRGRRVTKEMAKGGPWVHEEEPDLEFGNSKDGTCMSVSAKLANWQPSNPNAQAPKTLLQQINNSNGRKLLQSALNANYYPSRLLAHRDIG